MLSKGVAAFRAFTRNLPVWFRPLWPRSECPKFSIDARKRTGSIPPTQSFIGDPANGRSRPSADPAGERLSQHHVERGEPLRAKEVLGVKISCPGVQSNFVDAL